MELEFEHQSQPSGVRRVLARRYRPKFLQDLIGQDQLVQAMKSGIEEGRLPQAILLHGIRGTGKTSTARILARALNCTGPDGQGGPTIHPCGQCPSCKAFDEDRHPDVLEMDAASHTGVDDIREVIDSAQYRAILGRCKVFIIDEVHMLSKSAFNALLKTLEEPPSHVLFVFATTEINKIPETILSRCARFDLKRIPSKTLIDQFQTIAQKEGYGIEPDALAVLARAADGSVRDGLTLLDQAMNLTDAEGGKEITSATVQGMVGVTDRQQVYTILQHVLDQKAEEVIVAVRELTEKGEDPVAFFQDLMECLYRVACLKMIPRLASDETIPEFERRAAHTLAVRTEALNLLSLWKKMLKGYEDVRRAPFAQQALEMVLLRLCFAANLPSLEAFLQGPDRLEPPQEGSEASSGADGASESSNNSSPASGSSGSSGAGSYSAGMAPSAQPTSGASAGAMPQALEGTRPAPQSIQTADALLNLLEQEREVLLVNYLKRDVSFVQFEPGTITLQLKNENASKILPMLKSFLLKATGTPWMIQIDTKGEAKPSIYEKVQASQEAVKEETLQSPLLQTIKKEFPDASVEFEFDEDYQLQDDE